MRGAISQEKGAESEQDFYPFSLVLGTNFQPSPAYSVLSSGDREVRTRLEPLVGPSNPQAIGRFVNILADAQIRFKQIPELEPHLYRGVTFHDPNTLYYDWQRRGDVGPVLGEMMRNLIRNATKASFTGRPEAPPAKNRRFRFLHLGGKRKDLT